MQQPLICCQQPQTLTHGKSPFSKIIALGFYDGPTSGILQCDTCLNNYKFEMIDWDDNQEVRIFRLASLPEDSLVRCVKALAEIEPPRWPVWVPFFRKQPSEEARTAADREIDHILKAAQPAEMLVAWEGYGEKILAATKVPASELNQVPDWFSLEDPSTAPDWFSLLGVPRVKQESSDNVGR